MGPKTIEFEKEFKKYIGADHAISINSCTAALHLALKVAGIGEGDEVIIPTMTFTATGEVITYLGARPVLVDVEPKTCNMDIKALEAKISQKTRAIIPVHFGGQPCDMDEIMAMAEERGIVVIEDAAHSLPAWYKERKIGTIGDMTCFSFYATKTLATGEGGMVTTDNGKWAEALAILRLHGISRDAWKRYTKEGSWYYEVVDAGFKYNLTDVQAALGLAQLRKLEDMWRKRARVAAKYDEAFGTMEEIDTPLVKEDRRSAWHLYVIRLNLRALKIDRNRFIEELKDRKIGTSVHFIPLYRHPYYRRTLDCDAKSFPASEFLFERIVSLPIYPSMSDPDTDYVIENVRQVCKKYRR